MNRQENFSFSEVAQAWRTQLQQVATAPWLARLLLCQSRTLLTRMTTAYRRRMALAGSRRRAFLRHIGPALAGAALSLTLTQNPAQAATIDVTVGNPAIEADGQCSLIEALVNANEDAATYADCAPGSGADTITLKEKEYKLWRAHNSSDAGANGLPVITSPITIEGNGAVIARNEDAGEFRILTVEASGDLTLRNTTVSGGYLGPDSGYAYGAGIYNAGGKVTLTNSTVSNNASVYFGGGIFNHEGVVSLTNSTVSGNTTEDDGAGIVNYYGTVTLVNSTISGNSAYDSEGGGLFNEIYSTVTLVNSTVSGNHAGYGGAGISNDGVLTMINSTITQNNTDGTGGGLRTRTTAFTTIERSIISGNTAGVAGNEVYNRYGTVGTDGELNVNAFNLFGNSSETNAEAFAANNLFTPGATDLTATSDGAHPTALKALLDRTLQNNGGATATHALVSNSLAQDAAPTGPATDQRGMVRPRGTNYDIGAFELLTPPKVKLIYLSSFEPGTVGGVPFNDEDILTYDTESGNWEKVFDGSDVGLGHADVDAFYLAPDGNILLSLDRPLNLPGLGIIDDADILRFIPNTLGNRTTGAFERFFTGAAVGLEQNSEDIDAIAYTPDGQLLLSTKGKTEVSGLTAYDEDLLAFTATSLGAQTQGSWSLYFDGSDLGLTEAGEDISSAWNHHGDLYLTTKGKFDAFDGVTEVKGDGETIFAFTPFSTGDTTSGLIFDVLDENLFDFERSIDGLALVLGSELPSHLTVVQSAADDTGEVEQFALAPDETAAIMVDEELNAYDSEVDDTATVVNKRLFLPLIQQ